MGRWTSIVAVTIPLIRGGSTTVLQSIWRSMDGESSLVRYGNVEVISPNDRSCPMEEAFRKAERNWCRAQLKDFEIYRCIEVNDKLQPYPISPKFPRVNATLYCTHRWWICFQPRFFTWFDHQSWYPLGRPVATSLGECISVWRVSSNLLNHIEPTKSLQVFSYLFIHFALHISLVALVHFQKLSSGLGSRQKNTKAIKWNQLSFNNRSNQNLIEPIVYNKYSTLCYQDHLSWHADHGCAPMANPAKLWQLLGFEQCLLLYACVVPWQALGH